MTEFISRSYGQDEFEVIIKTDNKEHYKKAEDFSRKLIDHAKPQTNADRIRAMSDEELFKLIGHNSLCDQIQNDERTWCEAQAVCDGCLLEWLKQPSE